MQVLIIEDDPHKLSLLADLVRRELPDATVVEARSHQSGLRSAVEGSPDLVLLDMSLPTFDMSAEESGWRPRPFGGRQILRRMSRRGISCPVVVVTGYEILGEGEELLTFEELGAELAERFPTLYRGAVFYHPAQTGWLAELSMLIHEVISS